MQRRTFLTGVFSTLAVLVAGLTRVGGSVNDRRCVLLRPRPQQHA